MNIPKFLTTVLLVALCLINVVLAQTTAFTYQGKLTDAGNPANGTYDLQFRLFDALLSGNQVGSTIVREDVTVSSGIFTVTLDFGAAVFAGANRWLEISVRPGVSTGAFTTLAPLQPITATPYALMSLNAATANAANSLSAACTLCLTDAQIAAVSGSKISGAVATATNATTATTAVNFSGSLAGDVTGAQSTTAIANNAVTTAKLADGSVTNPKLANGSVTDAKIVDVAGSKITGSLTTATLPGANVTGAVPNATSAVNFSGSLAGGVTGTQGATVIANNAVTTAKLADGSVTDAKIVSVSGNKLTGSITTATLPGANVTGTVANATNATNAINATNATTASGFSGALAGDVTGTQSATVVSAVGGQSASNVANGALAANAATAANIPNTIVRRDASGSFSAGTLTGNGSGLTNVPGTLQWQVVAGTTQQAQPNTGYVVTNASQVTITLPTNPNVGDLVRVSGVGAGGWKIVQNAGQSVIGTNIGTFGLNWTPRENNRNWYSVASSADGSKLVAVEQGDKIYTSTDSGVSWTPRNSGGIFWQSVASSADGNKLVAVEVNFKIYTSTDSGVSWTPRESNRSWWSVASSADGSKLVAVVGGFFAGQIYTSTDSGVTWTPRESNRNWYSVASSADGNKLVA
ncbi:MAG: hypothetical protein HYR56_35440, partial [Acidobacteria bacterium]|nr:hypothetical protein [Acidobacteriota bacterium]